MSDVATFRLDPVSKAQFLRGIDAMVRNTTLSSTKILHHAGLSFALSGRKMTPICKQRTRRDVIPAGTMSPSARQRAYRRGVPHGSLSTMWAVIVRTQDNPPNPVLIEDPTITTAVAARRHRLAEVPNKKASRNSWNGVLRDLGKTTGSRWLDYVGRSAFSGSEARRRLVIWNKLKYLLTIAPAMPAEAMRKAGKSLEIIAFKIMQNNWKRKP